MATKKKPPLIDVSAMEPIPKPKTTTEHPNKKQPPKVVKNVKKPVAKMTDSAKKRITATAVKALDDSIEAAEKIVKAKSPKDIKAAEKAFAKIAAKAAKAVEKVESVAASKPAKAFEKLAKKAAESKLSSDIGGKGRPVTVKPKTAGEGRLLTSGEVAGLNKIFKAASQKAAATPPKPAKAKPKDVPDVRDLIRNAAKEAFK